MFWVFMKKPPHMSHDVTPCTFTHQSSTLMLMVGGEGGENGRMQMLAEEPALCPSCGGRHANVQMVEAVSELMICPKDFEEGESPSGSISISVFSKHQNVGYITVMHAAQNDPGEHPLLVLH